MVGAWVVISLLRRLWIVHMMVGTRSSCVDDDNVIVVAEEDNNNNNNDRCG